MNDGPASLKLRKSNSSPSSYGFILLVALIFVAYVGFVIVAARYESSTYNRLTGAQTTWFDALWVELRVQDTPKPPPVSKQNTPP